MYTAGRLLADAAKIASNASTDYFFDIAMHAAEETLADFYSQEWPFNVGEGSIATIAPYSTGTITFTNGSAAATGVGTSWLTSWPSPAVLRPSDSNGEPLVVRSFDSTTGLTLDRAYPFTTPSSPVGYSLEFTCYPTSEYIAISGVCIAMSGWQPALRLQSLQEILYHRQWWTPGIYPYEFFLIPGDGTTSACLVLNPAPSQVQTIRFRYTRAVPTFRCLVGNGNAAEEGGLATLAAAGTALTGSNTSWLKLGYSLVGDYFSVGDQDGVYSAVSAVASDTAATVGAWGGRAISSSAYYIAPKILIPDDMRPMLRDLMRWKYLQNAKELELAKGAEERYRMNLDRAWQRVNRMRMDRDVKPVDIGRSFYAEVEPPGMPWQITTSYVP